MPEATEPPRQEPPAGSEHERPLPAVPKAPQTFGRAGRRARSTSVLAGRGAARIEWTSEAKAVRLALTTYQAQIRKLSERAQDARKAARRLSPDDLAVIVAKVAEDTGADAVLLAEAAGLELEQPQT